MNRIRTAFLLTCLTLLLVAMGNLIGGRSGMIFAFFMAGVMNFFTYWFSDKRSGNAVGENLQRRWE